MSTVENSSTNDVTSASETNTSTHRGHTGPSLGLTTDAIIKECIKQGFYRNPICNEKLYLHNRGYDHIVPTAFEPYTDVKVLWLEGNALASLPCGAPYIQVQPPKRHDPFAEEEEEVPQEPRASHVDPTDLSAPPVEKTPAVAPTLPEASAVALEERDGFSSLYPTVRQLYLHNNVFRVMPDLSRFERLDAINLSNNFFPTVEPHCPAYDEARRSFMDQDARDVAIGAAQSKSAATERQQHPPVAREKEEAEEEGEEAKQEGERLVESYVDSMALTEVPHVVSAEESKRRHEVELQRCRHIAEKFSVFCPHPPLDADDESGKLPDIVPLDQRNVCSSLRTLNLSANRLETFMDCVGLLCYKSLTVLDLSRNEIADGEALLLILERLPKLRSLKLTGNPCVRSLPRYRKNVVGRCKKLLHLDDRPVFDDERRLVTAWMIGGDAAEAREREAIKQETERAHEKRLDDFRELIQRHRATAAPHGAAYIAAVADPPVEEAGSSSHLPRGNVIDRDNKGRYYRERNVADGDASSATSSEEEEEEDGSPASPPITTIHASAIHLNSAAAEEEEEVPQNRSRVLSSNGNAPPSRVEVLEDDGDIFVPD